MKFDDIHITAGAFITTAIILVGLYRIGAWLLPRFRRIGHFLDAWEGYTEPGTGKQVLGVMERLTRVEDTAATAASAAAAANDRLDHVSGQVAEVDRKVDQVAARQDTLAAEQTQIRSAIDEMRTHGTDADPAT